MNNGRAFNMNNVVIQCDIFDIDHHLEEMDDLKQHQAQLNLK